MAPPDCPLLKRQVRVRRDVLIQYLRQHSSEKLIRSVKGVDGSVLFRPALTSLLGYQYSPPLRKLHGYAVRITLQHNPHSLPEGLCSLLEMFPPVATGTIPSRGLPAIESFQNNPPDFFVNGLHRPGSRSFRMRISPTNKWWIQRIPCPLNTNHALPKLSNLVCQRVLEAC